MALLGKYSSLKSTKFCEAAAQTRNTCTIQSLLYKIKPISSVHQEHTHTHLTHVRSYTQTHTIHSFIVLFILKQKSPPSAGFPAQTHPRQRGDVSVVCDGMCVLVCVANMVLYLPAMQLLLVVIATIIGKL